MQDQAEFAFGFCFLDVRCLADNDCVAALARVAAQRGADARAAAVGEAGQTAPQGPPGGGLPATRGGVYGGEAPGSMGLGGGVSAAC